MNSLKDCTVLITGGAGFVGSVIADQLLTENVKEIILIDNFVRGSKSNIGPALASGKVRLVEGDIRDRQLMDSLFKGVDYCFHMAALRITQCAAEPRQAFEVMCEGTLNVVEACKKHRIRKMIAASSASIYGTAESFPTHESHHPYNNHTLYGAAKIFNELMYRSYHDMFSFNYCAMRYFNVYGPRMDIYGKYTEVLIKWYHLIKAGKPPLIYGDGKQTMDFIFIDDIARANILALKSEVTDEVFNVACGVETSLEALCILFLKVMHSQLEPEYIPIPEDRKKVEVARRLADISKASTLLGFNAEIQLEEGLKRLVQWLDIQNPSSQPQK